MTTTTTTKQPPPFASFPRSGSSGTSSFSVSRAGSRNHQSQNHQAGDRALLGSGRSAFSGLPSSSVETSSPPAQSPKPSSSLGWTGRSSYNRSITSTSATAFIRRKSPTGNGPFNRNPMKHPTDASSSSGDDTISNGEFVSKKVTVGLSCEPEETVVKFNFTNPFRGVIQAGPSNSPCKIKGDGRKQYSLGVPHASCGTKHVSSTGSFFNTLFIRYHPSLEMEGDQLKSIVCKFGTGSFFVG